MSGPDITTEVPASKAESQARRLLWVFPGWLRPTRGEEAVGLVLDLQRSTNHLGLRYRADLVRAGLHARRMGLPPILIWVGVLLAGDRIRTGAVPVGWLPWLTHWLRSPRWRWRLTAQRFLLSWMVLMAWLLSGPDGGSDKGGALAVSLPAVLVIAFISHRDDVALTWRDRVLRRNGLDDNLRPVTDAEPVPPRVETRMPNLPATVVLAVFAVLPSIMAAWSGLAAAHLVDSSPPGRENLVKILVVLTAGLIVTGRALRRPPPEAEDTSAPLAKATHPALLVIVVLSWLFAVDLAGESTNDLLAVGVPAISSAAVLLLLVVVHRREKQVERPLGLWDLWPGLRPSDRRPARPTKPARPAED